MTLAAFLTTALILTVAYATLSGLATLARTVFLAVAEKAAKV